MSHIIDELAETRVCRLMAEEALVKVASPNDAQKIEGWNIAIGLLNRSGGTGAVAVLVTFDNARVWEIHKSATDSSNSQLKAVAKRYLCVLKETFERSPSGLPMLRRKQAAGLHIN